MQVDEMVEMVEYIIGVELHDDMHHLDEMVGMVQMVDKYW